MVQNSGKVVITSMENMESSGNTILIKILDQVHIQMASHVDSSKARQSYPIFCRETQKHIILFTIYTNYPNVIPAFVPD